MRTPLRVQVREHRRAWFVLGGLVAAVLIGYSTYYVWVQTPTDVPRGTDHPAIQTQPLNPSTYDKVRRWFGPWNHVAQGSTGSPRLVMLMANGGQERSSWTPRLPVVWKSADPPQIGAISVGKKVTIQTNGIATYTVDFKQPFIIQQVPDKVYMFLPDGSKYAIVSTTPAALHKLGNKR